MNPFVILRNLSLHRLIYRIFLAGAWTFVKIIVLIIYYVLGELLTQ